MKKCQILLGVMIGLVIFHIFNVEVTTIAKDITPFQEVTKTVPISAANGIVYEPATPAQKLTQQFLGRFEEEHTYGDNDFYLDIKTDDNSELTFTSKNTNVVTVSQTGQVSIVGAGTTYITVTAKENENYLAGETKIKVKIYRKSIKSLKLVIPKFGDILQFDSMSLAGNGNSGTKKKEEFDWEGLYDRLLFFDGDICLQRNKDYYVSDARVGWFGNYVKITGKNNYRGTKKFNIGSIYAPRMSCLNPMNNGINVAWDGSDFALGYIVYRKTGKGQYKEVARIDNGKTQSYFDADKKVNGKFYTYKVKVITKNKKKYLYKFSKNTIKLQYLTPPSKLKLRQKSDGQVYATWQGNKKADGYEVCCLENKNDNKNSEFKYTFEGKNTKTGDLILLRKGKTYYVYVRAYTKNKDGRYYSDWSKGKKIKVK